MPYLKIQINQNIEDSKAQKLALSASAQLAEALGKPERYVMVDVAINPKMVMSASTDACAYVELKSIGLQASQTHTLSQTICSFLHSELAIDSERIYIEFADVQRTFWGWNHSTF